MKNQLDSGNNSTTMEFREIYEWRMNVSRVQEALEPPAHGEFMAIP